MGETQTLGVLIIRNADVRSVLFITFYFPGDGLSGDVFKATMQRSGSTVVLKNVGDAQGANEINCYRRIEGLSGVAQVRTL